MVENIIFYDNDLKFRLPFGAIIFGSSTSGKTRLVERIIRNANEMIEPAPQQIVYAYGEYNEAVRRIKKLGATTHEGMPNEDFLAKCKRPLLLILDDLMLAASNSQLLNDLYTKKAHHQKIGIIFITQNLFDKSLRIIRSNSQYVILMRAPNAALQIQTLGIQLFPKQLSYFLDAYKKATVNPYGYILIDLHPASNTLLKLRTDIFPEDKESSVFLPKNESGTS